jgi:hypothetical protein
VAYRYNPYTNAYEYYPDGTTPPPINNSGDEQIPGWSDFYTQEFPNQPYSQANPTGNSSSSNSSGTSGTSGTGDDLDPAKRDAYSYLMNLFKSYGLDSLAPKILEYVQQGYGPDTISLMLQDTPEYKQRFKANDLRIKNGLSVLSPAEYTALERTYRQILESNGMPTGFYDSLDDFSQWIADDVSPTEIQERVTDAASAVNNTDQSYISALRDYGLGQGDLVAAMLDRSRALPLLQKTIREAQIGAEARRQGLQLSQTRADYFESMGVTGSEAAEAYQTIGAVLPTLEQLGNIYGDDDYDQSTIEDELLGRSGLASQRRANLQAREQGSFSGSTGIGQKTLAGKSRGEF